MVKRSSIRFSQLQAFLERLGFCGARHKQGWRFEHQEAADFLASRLDSDLWFEVVVEKP